MLRRLKIFVVTLRCHCVLADMNLQPKTNQISKLTKASLTCPSLGSMTLEVGRTNALARVIHPNECPTGPSTHQVPDHGLIAKPCGVEER